MSKGVVSLVMPAWQPRTDWLRQAVRAALNEQSCRIELVVIDDGSPEPVAPLLSSFEDRRLRVIRVQHGGASAARNVGMAEARGDYVRFIDADDVIAFESTARLLKLTEHRDDVIAYGATMFCDEDLRPLWKMTSDVEGDAVAACLLGRFTTRPHALLFPRGVVEAAGEWSGDIRVSHDWDFILRALEHAPVRGMRSVATFYRRHPGGITANVADAARDAERVVRRYFDRHPEQRGTGLERSARARALAHGGRVYATRGHLLEGLRLLGRAARLDPRAVTVEVVQGMPAAVARGRRLFRGHPPGPPESQQPPPDEG